MKYFIKNGNAQQGPYSIYDLKDMSLNANAYVRAEGTNAWVRAKDVEELCRFLGFTGNEPLPPQVQTVQAVPVELPRPKKSHVGCIVLLLLFIVLAGAMVVTNPGKQRHAQVVSERVGDIIESALLPQQSSSPGSLGENLVKEGIEILRNVFGSKTAQSAIESLLDYHNYFLFSTTTIQLFDKPQTISVGIFGQIITVNEDNVRRFAEDNSIVRNEQSTGSEAEREVEQQEQGQGLEQETEMPTQHESDKKANDLVKDIEQEVIRSIGNIAKKQVEQRTDSTTGSALGKVIDGVTDMLKEHVKVK